MSVRKMTIMLVLINGLQLVLGGVILIGLQMNIIEFSETLLELSLGLVFLSSLLLLAGIVSVLRYQYRGFKEQMTNLENLNIKLREQRHDYLNQIQIVYGLLELEEYESAREYIQPVFKDIMKVNRAIRTAHPAVNALLQAKMEEAERQKIDFYLEVSSQLKELPMEPWEFCKILANLIDNAITAAGRLETEGAEAEEGDRWIRLRMEEKPDVYHILIENNGPEIPKHQQKMIFIRGYTTKKGEGHGQGLAIVTALLKEANGSISVDSSEEETSFSVILPKQKQKDRTGRKRAISVLSVHPKKMTG